MGWGLVGKGRNGKDGFWTKMKLGKTAKGQDRYWAEWEKGQVGKGEKKRAKLENFGRNGIGQTGNKPL